jgi:hypothetical protein
MPAAGGHDFIQPAALCGHHDCCRIASFDAARTAGLTLTALGAQDHLGATLPKQASHKGQKEADHDKNTCAVDSQKHGYEVLLERPIKDGPTADRRCCRFSEKQV